MAKNRLEKAFKSAPQPPPEKGGGERDSTDEALATISGCLPGNYFASEQERARWKIIHQYDQEGRVAEVWNHPLFQVMDTENVSKNFAITKPPAGAEHLTALMLEQHYRELMNRLLEKPSSINTLLPEPTVAELFSFMMEALEQGLLANIKTDAAAMAIYRCLERLYGEKDAYLFYRVQLSGFYREMEIEGRTFRDNDFYTLKHSIPTTRSCWKFVQDKFDPGEFTDEQRKAMDNFLKLLAKSVVTNRERLGMLKQEFASAVVEFSIKGMMAVQLFDKHKTWRGWIPQEGA